MEKDPSASLFLFSKMYINFIFTPVFFISTGEQITSLTVLRWKIAPILFSDYLKLYTETSPRMLPTNRKSSVYSSRWKFLETCPSACTSCSKFTLPLCKFIRTTAEMVESLLQASTTAVGTFSKEISLTLYTLAYRAPTENWEKSKLKPLQKRRRPSSVPAAINFVPSRVRISTKRISSLDAFGL